MITQTLRAGPFDLTHPTAASVNLDLIADSLAKIARFNGNNLGDPYSVAQHSVLGADQIWRDLKRSDCAAYYLFHDAKEHVLSDESTPKKAAADAIVDQILLARGYSELVGLGEIARRRLEEPIDRAIHEAVGLAWPPTNEIAAIVKKYDTAMLATERRFLETAAGARWPDAIEKIAPLPIKAIAPWPWRKAAASFRDRMRKYLPALQSNAA